MKKRTMDAFIRGISPKTSSLEKWQLKHLTTDHRFVSMAASKPRLTRASVSDSPFDDLIVTSASAGQIEIVVRSRDELGRSPVENVTIDGQGAIQAILPMRINLDALSDLIVVRKGASVPSAIITAPTAVFVVKTTADDGDCNVAETCSLRDAIRRANSTSGASTIYFDLPTSPATIAPLSPLPAILSPITIQGSHLPNGTKAVEISGANAGTAVDGLKVRTSNAFIFDLAITGFKSITQNGSQVGGNGIAIESDSARPNNHGNNVLACFLGIDATGTTAKPNMAAGLLIFDSDENAITNTVASGNNTGIAIEGGNSNNFAGNILGLDAAGSTTVPNSMGMFLGGANNTVGGDFAGAPNTISGNGVASNIAPCVGYGIYAPIFVDLATQQLLSHDNNIVGNKIGTDPSGGVGLGNCWQGIQAEPLTGTTIGSVAESGRNIISGNGLGGVWCVAVGDANSTEGGFCSIMGNNVGTDITGSYSIPNNVRNITPLSGSTGAVMVASNISVSAVGAPGGTTAGGACTGFCNLVSGNSTGFDNDAAIVVGGPGNIGVFNNFVGTKRNGTQVLENGRSGIALYSTTVADSSPEYFAGGYTDLDGSLGNLVAGNNDTGIGVGYVGGSDGPGTYHVLGNLIGTDVSGQLAIPNGSGMFIGTRFANEVEIGDSNPLGSNVIAGNALDGINIFTGFGVKIIGNAIGVNSNQAPLGNGGTGVNIGGYFAFSTIVGGTDSTTTNIIANNGKSGVKVNGITSTFNAIRGNAIYNNSQLGIDLNQAGYFPDGDGVTPNDDCEKDADLGANRLQNYPVLFAPVYNQDGTVRVTGTLISEPFHHFRIDVYANLVADPSGHGEGRSFLGTAEVTVDGNGFGNIDWTSLGTAPNGAFISATATDDLGNTSEFSCTAGQSCDGNAAYKDLAEYLASSPLTCPASIVVNIETDEPDVTGDQVCDVDTQNSGLQCSLRAALQLVTSQGYLGSKTITFDIPGSGVHTISPSSPLPVINKSTTIRGTSQPGWTNLTGPLIEISGLNQSSGDGLNLAPGSDGSQIDGLTVNRFIGDGIVVSSNSNSIERCLIGLNAAGNQVFPNRRSPNGIRITGSDNTIGGSVSTSQNFIAGSSQNQILITGSAANRNNVFGNVIGSDRAGNIYFGLVSGVRVESGATSNRIGGADQSQFNYIWGAKHAGIEIVDGADSNFVLFNIIRRGYAGVAIIRSANNTVGIAGVPNSTHVLQAIDNFIGIHIGDETPTYPTNLLSIQKPNFGSVGAILATPTDQIQTQSNKIYGSAFGSHDLNESHVGAFVGTATTTEIGGTGNAGNVIDGNDFGVWLSSAAFRNTVRANTIGHDGAPNNNGMLIQGKENTIRGNTISNNTQSGIVFQHISENDFPARNKVFTNFIGVIDGSVAAGNGLHGIELDGQDNDIGLDGHGNVISGNSNGCGIQITDSGDNNRINGNAIGIGFGSVVLPNLNGICIFGGLNKVTGNTISGNTRRGVDIGRDPLHPEQTPPRFNVLTGNQIGTSLDGGYAVPNGLDGVLITDGAFQNTIGGTGTGEGNLISGNRDSGILIGLPGANSLPFGNEILGNRIGTNADGDSSIPNEKFGIAIYQSQGNNIGGFGTDMPGARNIISGNGLVGVLISGAGSYQTRVSGNYIGVGADGFQPLGNGHNGVYITVGAHDNIIGGTESNSGNVIANNGRNGVALAPDAGSGNLIDPNTIAANTMRGITLNETAAEDDLNAPPPEPVLNDELDFDLGANKLQNYPEIATYNINTNGDLIVSYRVDSLPGNSNYGFSEGIYVEFFKADVFGQGERFLNSDHFTFDDFVAGGNKTVNLGNAAQLGFFPGDLITSTATDADGNTSEFSPVLPPTAASATVAGSVRYKEGRPVSNARIAIADEQGRSHQAITNGFGQFRFEGIEAGRTYIISADHKTVRFVRPSFVLTVSDAVEDADFTALE